jgi:DNA repair protein RadA/Sms
VYASAVGGVRIREPGADLALALALASSRLDVALPADVAAFGEVGLGGEQRRVAHLEARVEEAARLRFRRLLVPAGAHDGLSTPPGARLIPVASLGDAVAWLRSNGVHESEAAR